MRRIQVLVSASDPLNHAGVTAMLRGCSEVDLLPDDAGERADVVVLAERTMGAGRLHAFGRSRAGTRAVGVVVADGFDADDTLLAVRCGVKSILPATAATQGRLVAAVTGAPKGVSLLPGRLQAALLRDLDDLRAQVLEPNGLSLSRLDARERDLIGFVAEGLATDEIAARVGCSEGTVKNTLNALMRRLGLNNRTHVVAYAFRSGVLA